MTIYIVSKQGVEWNELHSAHQTKEGAQAERDHMEAQRAKSDNVFDKLSTYVITTMELLP